MLIGELSRATGFSADTIRWYEKIGLINLDKQSRSENNYRNYSPAIQERLLLIRQIKSFGFTLKETKELLMLDKSEELTCDSIAIILEGRLTKIEEKITELKLLKNKLVSIKTNCDGDCKAAFTAN